MSQRSQQLRRTVAIKSRNRPVPPNPVIAPAPLEPRPLHWKPRDAPADGRLDEEPEREEAALATVVNAIRAELSRVAADFARTAAERTTRRKQILDRANAQGQARGERVARLDQRAAERGEHGEALDHATPEHVAEARAHG